jgi:hypothetical protein
MPCVSMAIAFPSIVSVMKKIPVFSVVKSPLITE